MRKDGPAPAAEVSSWLRRRSRAPDATIRRDWLIDAPVERSLTACGH
ncbi:hypothetical protein NI17_005010 [Thermobifida halotolerans]|uniref:Uncharacterized protein n=1 Tax=Thermobifida halotolerans TaxID=483545 RepID=A0AA97M4Q7_9ACTN|nr:hypothetical protein [Thermobifida halotolerans]UOE20579.1 hypothetical protein NI17_005010 [Thermobifida halotolerans]